MAREGIFPDLVLSSPSVRTRETCTLAFAKLRRQPAVEFRDALYLASPVTMLSQISQVPPSVRHLMLVGHNPGMHVLAMDLAGSASSADRANLSEKFPTAGLAVLDFEIAAWPEITSRGGRLIYFMTPKRLSA